MRTEDVGFDGLIDGFHLRIKTLYNYVEAEVIRTRAHRIGADTLKEVVGNISNAVLAVYEDYQDMESALRDLPNSEIVKHEED